MLSSIFTKPLNLESCPLTKLLGELQSQAGFMWLDSASEGHLNNHFSVCVWRPKAMLETRTSVTTIRYRQGAEPYVSSDDPLTLINKELASLKSLPNDDFPFSGGAVGYWGYELGGRFESLPTPKSHGIDLPDMAVGIYDFALVIQHNQDGNTSADITFISQADESVTETELTKLNDVIKRHNATNLSVEVRHKHHRVPFKLTSPWQSNMSKHDYAQKFHQVQEYLLSGDCYQINLAQRFQAQYSGDEWDAYLALRKANKAPFSSFIRLQSGAVLSLSPERFVQVNGRAVETKPIKGTRPRGKNADDDNANAKILSAAPKDRAENLMIVDLLRNDLSKVSLAGSVKVPKLFAIESYPAVHHLVSTVTSILKPNALSVDLLRGAFPGGSITGAPKIRAMQIINELEPHPRSVYCGAIGYIKPNGDMDTNITIRTLVCNKKMIYCWAGGGLVADSNCDDEYQETLDKVNKILPILSSL